MNVLVISTCKYKLHEEEFVKPVTYILKNESIEYNTIHISKLSELCEREICAYSHIIFCGTALKDFTYFQYNITATLNTIHKLNISTFTICAGAQIICKYYNLSLQEQLHIAVLQTLCLNSSSQLGIEKDSTQQVYAIHSYNISLNEVEKAKLTLPNSSIIPILSNISRQDDIELLEIDNFVVTFFHPEIKNKELIINWLYSSKNNN
ncbi:MAG: hypothetical protein ACLFPL_04755 [Candidatus Nanoarchaeia archaeon]